MEFFTTGITGFSLDFGPVSITGITRHRTRETTGITGIHVFLCVKL
jgi:hypothetical protein